MTYTVGRIEFAPLPLAVRLRDEAGPRLPQMIANRRAQLAIEMESFFSRERDNAACRPVDCINGKCRETGECACPPWPATDREYANLALTDRQRDEALRKEQAEQQQDGKQ